jgi:thiol-disulfide isomerase/thioredoxin
MLVPRRRLRVPGAKLLKPLALYSTYRKMFTSRVTCPQAYRLSTRQRLATPASYDLLAWRIAALNKTYIAKLRRLFPLLFFAFAIGLFPPLAQKLFPPKLPIEMLSLYEIPRQLPQIEFHDVLDRNLTLKDFRGTFILLNVWATWCPPCKQEMPSLNQLASHFAAKDLTILPLSVDVSGVTAVRNFYKRMGIDKLAIYVDTSTQAMHLLGASGIPTTLLIDRDGLEMGRLIGATNWDTPEILDRLSKTMGIAPTE